MPSAADRSVVGIFARAPQPGLAKTRLIASLGEQGAATLHMRLVERTVATVRTAQVGHVELWCSPSPEHDFFVSLARGTGCVLRRQRDADLGTRMSEAFRAMLGDMQVAIIVGSDCPMLAAEDLRRAQRSLAEGWDVVLGPAEDGGYYLIGLRRPEPGLFEGIEWGSERVLEQTRARLHALRLRWQETALRWDIDRPADLDRVRADSTLEGLLAGLAPGIEAA
jgi:hypothetical protein